VTVAAAVPASPALAGHEAEVSHVLAGVMLAGTAAQLAGLLDRRFLSSAGWDPVRQILVPPAGHRFIRADRKLAGGDPGSGQGTPAGLLRKLPLPGAATCLVAACLRDQAGRGPYCRGHGMAWRSVREAEPGAGEQRWRQTAEPVPVRGFSHVNLRGLAPLVITELLRPAAADPP